MKNHNASASGGFLTLLLVLFIGLKLGRVIEWSWLWVLSPFWIPLALFLLVVLVALFAMWREQRRG